MSARIRKTSLRSARLGGGRFLQRVLVVLFGTAVGTVGAQELRPPDIAHQRLALEVRVALVRQAFGTPGPSNGSSQGKTVDAPGGTEPFAQWYNWPNWGNWANWNNWNNWGNWFNR